MKLLSTLLSLYKDSPIGKELLTHLNLGGHCAGHTHYFMRTLLKHAYRPEEAKPKNATNILHDKDAKARDAGLLYSPKIRELQSANEVSWSFNSGSSLDRLLTDFNTLQLQVKKKNFALWHVYEWFTGWT